MMDRVYENSHHSGDQWVTKYLISGIEICREAWCKVLAVSEKHASKIQHMVCKGEVSFHII